MIELPNVIGLYLVASLTVMVLRALRVNLKLKRIKRKYGREKITME
jgi:hypothetical protein